MSAIVAIKMTNHEEPLLREVDSIEIGKEMVFFYGPWEEDGSRTCVANPPSEWLEWFTVSNLSAKITCTDSYAKRQ